MSHPGTASKNVGGGSAKVDSHVLRTMLLELSGGASIVVGYQPTFPCDLDWIPDGSVFLDATDGFKLSNHALGRDVNQLILLDCSPRLIDKLLTDWFRDGGLSAFVCFTSAKPNDLGSLLQRVCSVYDVNLIGCELETSTGTNGYVLSYGRRFSLDWCQNKDLHERSYALGLQAEMLALNSHTDYEYVRFRVRHSRPRGNLAQMYLVPLVASLKRHCMLAVISHPPQFRRLNRVVPARLQDWVRDVLKRLMTK